MHLFLDFNIILRPKAVRSQKSEVRSQKSEVRSQVSEVRSQETGFRIKTYVFSGAIFKPRHCGLDPQSPVVLWGLWFGGCNDFSGAIFKPRHCGLDPQSPVVLWRLWFGGCNDSRRLNKYEKFRHKDTG